MKRLLRITLILVLAATTGLVGNLPEAKSDPNTVAETETAATETTPIPVSLPTLATAILNDKNERKGQIVDIDSEELTIKRGHTSAIVPIANIVRVEFDANSEDSIVWWPTSTGFIVIRGEDTVPEGNPVRLQVRLDGFEWEEKEQGIANISSEAVVDVDGEGTEYVEGIVAVVNSGKVRYVVNKIDFDVENQLLIITATATSRQE